MEAITPILALVLSVVGLTVSVLNYMRDRAKPRAWSEIAYHHRGPDPDSAIPAMTIRIANLGRRPVVILWIELRSEGRRKWYLPVTEPDFADVNNENIVEVLEVLEKHTLAQNSALRLLEGDVVDLIYWPKDCTRFMYSADDSYTYATKVYVKDCTGKLSRVRDDAKSLSVIFNAWSTQHSPEASNSV